ncbi:MAG: sel1 repeat family protein [Magnetococcus sp. YQC-5]
MAFFYHHFDIMARTGPGADVAIGAGRGVSILSSKTNIIFLLVFIVFCYVVAATPVHAFVSIEAEEFSAGLSPDAGLEANRQAALQGDALAQLNLGAMYYYGLGVPKNYSKALFWYRKAAHHGEALAQFKLGVMLAEGLGIARNQAASVQWFRQVAVKHFPMDSSSTDIVGWSQLRLGLMYKDGTGVVKDPGQSALWFRMAAARGYAMAQFHLGQLAADAGGDPVDALKWYKRAAARGHAEASAAVTALEKKMTSEQIAKATAAAAQPIPQETPPVVPDMHEAARPASVHQETHAKHDASSRSASSVVVRDDASPSLVRPQVDVGTPSLPQVQEQPNTLPLPTVPVPLRKEKSPPVVPSVGKAIYPLTVESDPPDAQVQVLNIDPPYYPGMALEPGRYHIKVSQEGFEAQQRWVALHNAPLRVPVKLARSATPVTTIPESPASSSSTPSQPIEQESKAAPAKPKLFSSLRVEPVPGDALVRIRNIREAYRPGMLLKPGRYLVEVSRPGYKTASRWMQLPGGGDFAITAPLELEAGP